MKTRYPILVLSLLVASCSEPRNHAADIPAIYAQAALDEVRNPVVVIHGILGARIEQQSTGQVVWGAFTSQSIDPNTPDGARALALPLDPIRSALDYDPLAGDTRATGPLEKLEIDLFFGVVNVDVYLDILKALGTGGYLDRVAATSLSPRYADDHYTCFSFFYDWRRDNVENAIALGRFLAEKRREVEASAQKRISRLRATGSPTDRREAERTEEWLARGFRFDVVAHSMGGLIARYYLRYGARDLPADGSLPPLDWAGAKDIDRLVIVGTPNLGSMEALKQLLEGFDPGPFLPHFDAALLGTMPSIYQLLPRPRHRLIVDRDGEPLDVDFLDPQVWIRNEWGILAPDSREHLAWIAGDAQDDAARRSRAIEYLTWCLRRAGQFHAALDVEPVTNSPSDLRLFAADAEPTLLAARLIEREGAPPLVDFSGADLFAPGDGTVCRYSAVGDERQGDPVRRRLQTPIPWRNVTFLSDEHVALTKNPHFVNNMLFQLLEEPVHPLSLPLASR